jgi:hypothetical protein
LSQIETTAVPVRRRWRATSPFLWAALTLLLALVPSVLWPGDVPWIFDEPAEVAIALRANQAHTLAAKGLSGNFNLHYGPLPMHIYQVMLIFSHDPRVLVVLRAILCSLTTAGCLIWLGRTLRLTPWFPAAVVLAPQLWLNNRILWAASFAIPISVLALAAYASFLNRKGGAALIAALGAALALMFIHPQSAPLSLVILGHMLWRHRPDIWRHRVGVAVLLTILFILNVQYLWYAVPAVCKGMLWYAHEGYSLVRISRLQAFFGPFIGGRLFGGLDFQEAYRRVHGPEGLIRAIGLLSSMSIPLECLGVAAIMWGGMGKYSCPCSSPAQDMGKRVRLPMPPIFFIALAGFVLQLLYFGALRIPPQPQYFFGTFGLHVLLAWVGVEALHFIPLRGVLVGLYGLCLGIVTLGSMWTIHRAGWADGPVSPTLNNQIEVVRQLNQYSDKSVRTNVTAYLYDPPHALRVLRLLQPPDALPTKESGRLVIRYKPASAGPTAPAAPIELIEAKTEADIPPDARTVLLDYPR